MIFSLANFCFTKNGLSATVKKFYTKFFDTASIPFAGFATIEKLIIFILLRKIKKS